MAARVVENRRITFRVPHSGMVPPAYLHGRTELPWNSMKRAHSMEVQRMNHRQAMDFLKVETNRRYTATPSSTFCNVAAHDFATVWGAYLPRIWWTKTAIDRMIQNREKVEPVYGAGVTLELNANTLFDWFINWGHRFGYVQYSETGAQELVDKGGFAVVVAKNVDLRKSGHISVVLPSQMMDLRVVKPIPEDTKAPLQWNAGRFNRERFKTEWYKNKTRFSSWLIWGIKP